MINKHSPFKGLNIRIPIMIPTKGREFINPGSTLVSHEKYDTGFTSKLVMSNIFRLVIEYSEQFQ